MTSLATTLFSARRLESSQIAVAVDIAREGDLPTPATVWILSWT